MNACFFQRDASKWQDLGFLQRLFIVKKVYLWFRPDSFPLLTTFETQVGKKRLKIFSFLNPGNCKWIRTPAIIYATHVATSLVPLLAHFLFHDFSDSTPAGPQTWHERLWLFAVYGPYLLIPLLLLMTMLLHPLYGSGEKRKTA